MVTLASVIFAVTIASSASVVVIDIPAEPSKLAVPVTSPATAIALAVVKVAAEPEVFWLPTAFTPGKSMFAEPSNETPPIVLGVVKVAAEPVVFWLPTAFTPGKLMFAEPSN